MLFANPNNQPKNQIQVFGCFGVVQIVRDDVKGLRSLLSVFLCECLCVWVQNVHRRFVKTRVEISIWNGKRARMQTTRTTKYYTPNFKICTTILNTLSICLHFTVLCPNNYPSRTTTTIAKAKAMQICILKRWHCSRI